MQSPIIQSSPIVNRTSTPVINVIAPPPVYNGRVEGSVVMGSKSQPNLATPIISNISRPIVQQSTQIPIQVQANTSVLKQAGQVNNGNVGPSPVGNILKKVPVKGQP